MSSISSSIFSENSLATMGSELSSYSDDVKNLKTLCDQLAQSQTIDNAKSFQQQIDQAVAAMNQKYPSSIDNRELANMKTWVDQATSTLCNKIDAYNVNYGPYVVGDDDWEKAKEEATNQLNQDKQDIQNNLENDLYIIVS